MPTRGGVVPTGAPSPPPEGVWHLIPLKHLLNHHPSGAPQASTPGTVQVRTSASSDSTQTYENYGDLDPLQLFMTFGYVDGNTRIVHSLPVEVDGGPLGRLLVTARPPRAGLPGQSSNHRDVPTLTRTGDGAGVQLRHLTLRPGNRGRLRDYLALAMRTAGADTARAAREADSLLDNIATANLRRYQQLASAARTGSPGRGSAEVIALGSLLQVCTAAQRLLQSWAG